MMLGPLLWLLAASAPLSGMSAAELDALLHSQQSQGMTFEARLYALAEASLGTPYADGPLGEGPGGRYDQDPLMDHTRVDCVTFIEQLAAMAASPSEGAAHDLLQRIRYAGGRIDYGSRNHFMVSDWVANNPWCIEVTGKLGAPPARVTRTISRRDFFERVKAPELGQDAPDQEITQTYVPLDQARLAGDKLPSPTLLLFIGKRPDWLFTLHTGLYLRDPSTGQGKLYHASSSAGKVVAVDLTEYLASQSERYLGFSAYRIESPRWGQERKSAGAP